MVRDDELEDELRRACEGLLMMSESDYPLEVVRWAGGDEVIAPARLRGLAGAGEDAPVETQSVDEFFRAAAAEREYHSAAERTLAERFSRLVSLLTDNLSGTLTYRVGEIDIAIFVVGKGRGGDWLGVRTRVVET